MKTLEYLVTNLEDNGVLTITINQPKKMNALSTGLLDELSLVFTQGLDDSLVKAFVITGAGEKAFVAGADISEFRSLNREAATAMSKKGQTLFRQIEVSPKPVIAAVNGYALGGGCELAMACHMRVASENAVFGQPEVNLGLIPGYGGTQRLVFLVGRGKATEWLMTGQTVKAPEALQWGLVNHVVPLETLTDTVHKILGKILSKSSLTISKIAACIEVATNSNVDGYEAEAQLFGACTETQDFKEGVAAFLEKRAPNFQGK